MLFIFLVFLGNILLGWRNYFTAAKNINREFIRGRSLLQSALRAVPFVASRHFPTPWGITSFKTVHWTVLKFTPCRAPKVNIDLRSIWDFVPNPARGAASGLCKRGIAPFETRCLSTVGRYGTLSLRVFLKPALFPCILIKPFIFTIKCPEMPDTADHPAAALHKPDCPVEIMS